MSTASLCGLCEESPAELRCADCAMDLCTASGCDADMHKAAKNANHVRTKIVRAKPLVISTSPPAASSAASSVLSSPVAAVSASVSIAAIQPHSPSPGTPRSSAASVLAARTRRAPSLASHPSLNYGSPLPSPQARPTTVDSPRATGPAAHLSLTDSFDSSDASRRSSIGDGAVLSMEELAAAAALSFQKTLSSDVSPETALALLEDVHSLEPIFGELFDRADLGSCQSILSVLTFQAGERIITAGEEASFAALLLDGDVIAQISPLIQVPLPKSSWVGEMAYFERNARSADITARTAATLAVLSYDDLERLNDNGQADLCNKFTRLLAMHSIKKLRKMTTTPAPTPASNAAGALGAGSSSLLAFAAKKETLFVERLKKQAALHYAEAEAKQREALANMKDMVKKRAADLAHTQVSSKNKLAKLEAENKEALYKLNEFTRKFASAQRKMQVAQEAAGKLLQDNAALTTQLPALEKTLQIERLDHKIAQNNLREAEASFERSLKAKDDSYAQLQQAMAQEKVLASAAYTARDEAVLQKSLMEAERNSVQSEVAGLEQRIVAMETERGFAEYRFKVLQERADQFEEDCIAWRRKSSELEDAHDKLRNKYRKDMLDERQAKTKIQVAHRTYHKLIRMLSLKTYVRNWVTRRFLFNIHLRISEMVVARWEEKIEAAGLGGGGSASSGPSARRSSGGASGGARPAPDNSLYQQLSNASQRTQKMMLGSASTLPAHADPGVQGSQPLMQPYPLAGSILSASVDARNPASSLSVYGYTESGDTQHYPREQLRMEKKKYLLALRNRRNPPASIPQLLQSIEEELIELKTPVDEMSLTIADLRATLDSFFKRNIQLTNKCMTTSRALEVAVGNYEAIKARVRQRHEQESSHNPFSQHLLLETSKQTAQRRAGVDEKEDFTSLSGLLSSGRTPSPAPSRPGTSAGRKSDNIDWDALDRERSSGYGVTHNRPHARRESRTNHSIGGTAFLKPQPPPGPHQRKPSGAASKPPLTPSNASPAAAYTVAPSPSSTAAFALPKVSAI